MNKHHAELERVTQVAEATTPTPLPLEEQVVFRIEKFGIGDARQLVKTAHLRPAQGAESQQLVIITKYITSEAQQALLKVVEEPPQTTRFLFIVPHSLQLLPTLQSRLAIADTPGIEAVCNIDAFLAFLEASVRERMEQIDTAVKKKDTAWINDIRCGLIDHLKQKVGMYTEEKLRALSFVVSTLETRGAANKMLLEELALTL